MFANYLIGLREGLEAALIVSILVAYLVRLERRDLLRPLWAGVGIAIGSALAFGTALTFGAASMSESAQEAFAGVLSLVAVGFVTWMVFWMKRAGRGIRGELHSRMDAAVTVGTWAVGTAGFIAVAREGLETALFLWTSYRANDSSGGALLGALLGLATAVLLGWLLYRGALRINLATFFRWTGVALIFVAAGVLAYGIHELQEAGWLPGEDDTAFALGYDRDGVAGTLVRGIFNITPTMSVLQVVGYLCYLIPTLFLYLREPRAASPESDPARPSAVTA